MSGSVTYHLDDVFKEVLRSSFVQDARNVDDLELEVLWSGCGVVVKLGRKPKGRRLLSGENSACYSRDD
jgi:hypothetical protein